MGDNKIKNAYTALALLECCFKTLANALENTRPKCENGPLAQLVRASDS